MPKVEAKPRNDNQVTLVKNSSEDSGIQPDVKKKKSWFRRTYKENKKYVRRKYR